MELNTIKECEDEMRWCEFMMFKFVPGVGIIIFFLAIIKIIINGG